MFLFNKYENGFYQIQKIIILFSLIFNLSFFVYSENIRVNNLQDVKLNDATDVVNFKIGVNDAIRIKLPKDKTYICGVELNLKIPEEIAAWRDSVAYSLFEGVTTAHSEVKNEFIGKRISFATIPGRLSLNIYIPLNDEFKIKDNPYSERIPVMPKLDSNDIFFRFQVIMKDVPETFDNAKMNVTVKSVLINKGMLNLSIDSEKQQDLPILKSENSISEKKVESKTDTDKTFSVFIDDKVYTSFKNILLKTGEHHASIVSDNYRNELRTFIIDQAKTTNLSVELRSIEPTLIFVCPLNTQIFFDEKQIDNPKTAYIIEPGEHSIKMVVGDYEIVKNLTAVNGRTYTISLDIDASIYEEN